MGQNEKYNVWLCNERAGLITHAQFVWIKSLRHIIYAVAHAQCLRQAFPLARRSEIGRQEIKMLGRSHTTRF